MRKGVVTALLIVVAMAVVIFPLFTQQAPFSSITDRQEFRLGVGAFHNARHNEAILSFSRLISEDPTHQLGRIWLGRSYYAAGFEAAALQEWQIAQRTGATHESLTYTVEAVEARRNGRARLRGAPDYILAAEIAGSPAVRQVVFSRPVGLHPRSDGSFLVTSFASNETLLLNVNGEVLNTYRSRSLPFDRPYGILEGSDGSLFVSEFGSDRVVRFTPQGTQIARFNRAGPHGLLAGPQYIATDQHDNIYVSDWGNRRVVKFNASGTFLLIMGQRHGEFGGLQNPTGVVYIDDSLYVADSKSATLVRFDSNGNFLEQYSLGDISGVEGISAYDHQRLLITSEGAIWLYDLTLQSIEMIIELPNGRVTSAVRDANGNIIATDFDRNQIFFFTPLDDLYSGLLVQTERIDSREYPTVFLSVSVTDRFERPVIGLEEKNFAVVEDGTQVPSLRVASADHLQREVDIVVVMPVTDILQERAAEITSLIEEIQGVQRGANAVGLVTASDQALLSVPLGDSPAAVRQAIQSEHRPTEEWDIDGALQLAINELLRSPVKRAMLLIYDGTMPPQAFSTLSLTTLERRLKNNHIHLYVISTAPAHPNPLIQLTEESEGGYLLFSQPESFLNIVTDMQRAQDGRYTLRYTSDTVHEFGQRYITVETIANLLQRSGGDESGYFAGIR